MQGLAFRAARCCDTQVPRDDKDAGDHNSNQDPGTGGEKYVCDIHSDFPLFDLMGIQNARRTISPGVNSGLSPRPVAVTGEVGKYLCFGGSPFELCSCFLLWKQQEPGIFSGLLILVTFGTAVTTLLLHWDPALGNINYRARPTATSNKPCSTLGSRNGLPCNSFLVVLSALPLKGNQLCCWFWNANTAQPDISPVAPYYV